VCVCVCMFSVNCVHVCSTNSMLFLMWVVLLIIFRRLDSGLVYKHTLDRQVLHLLHSIFVW